MGKVRFISNSLMNRCNFLIAFICVFSLFKCTNPKPNHESLYKPNQESLEKSNSITSFTKIMCKEEDFSYLFQCNNKESVYQVELFNDPFKDMILLTCSMNGVELDSVRYARFKFHTLKDKKAKLSYQERFILNPVTGDTLHFYFAPPKAIRIDRNRTELGRFFSDSIWKTKNLSDPPIELDGESWILKGRDGAKEIEVRRNVFRDTFFYSHVQMLLDICKIEDYKFPSD